MTRQLYELNHPLYPHQDLKKHHEQHKVQYSPHQGSYDEAYSNWYQIVRADHDQSGAPKRPIYREISQILRFKASGKDFLKYGETLIGFDHENNPVPFFHTAGEYTKPFFRTVYNYETKKANTIRSGQFETVFYIEYSPELLEELYQAGPDDKDIELLVNIGSMQYGGRGFYTYEEFKDLSVEELGRIGREGKGIFAGAVTNIPVGQMLNQLKHEGTDATAQQTIIKEFEEFTRWKKSQQTDNAPISSPSSSTSQPSQKIPEPQQQQTRAKFTIKQMRDESDPKE